jgi:hypothetical protein
MTHPTIKLEVEGEKKTSLNNSGVSGVDFGENFGHEDFHTP